ncbi:hypothetical protein H6F89_11370 [Cyanobacteria bacterium FACHB-63]|nr:hypothetical protein [Cyanobacteria bacterium FACHB-63]
MTKMLRANESDCQLFKFWFRDRVCDDIHYQNQLFLQLASFGLDCRDQDHELSAKLMERGFQSFSAALRSDTCSASILARAELDTSGKRSAKGRVEQQPCLQPGCFRLNGKNHCTSMLMLGQQFRPCLWKMCCGLPYRLSYL